MALAVEFEAPIVAMPWGRNTYTIIRLPDDAAAAWRSSGAKRVAGTIDGAPVNLAITTAPVMDGAFIWAGASLLRRLEAEAGDLVRCSLSPADPDEVLVPDDVEAALVERDLLRAWEAQRPAQRRALLYQVESARTEATRQRRLDALMRTLGQR
jgi:4-hydroxy-3-methylbut-2-en-1-yl diphosphate synthase IspG/GcpE